MGFVKYCTNKKAPGLPRRGLKKRLNQNSTIRIPFLKKYIPQHLHTQDVVYKPPCLTLYLLLEKQHMAYKIITQKMNTAKQGILWVTA